MTIRPALCRILCLGLFVLAIFAPTAHADPFQFTYATPVTAGGTPGVTDGDILTLAIIADNGNAGLISQSWFQADVVSAVATVGTYVAQFIFPHFTNDPVFVTDGLGDLVTSLWFDIDGNNTDNLGAGSPRFFDNTLRTSQNIFMDFLGGFPSNPSNWTVAAAAVPEPTTLTLLGFGLFGLVAARRRSQ